MVGEKWGSRQLMKDYGDRVREVVSFDGFYIWLVNTAVGASRYRLEVRTEGGHAYGNFGNRSAIHHLSLMISGGTSVNTIAQQAEMLYDYHSEDKECLQIMDCFA